jgi:hypothetical protein
MTDDQIRKAGTKVLRALQACGARNVSDGATILASALGSVLAQAPNTEQRRALTARLVEHLPEIVEQQAAALAAIRAHQH